MGSRHSPRKLRTKRLREYLLDLYLALLTPSNRYSRIHVVNLTSAKCNSFVVFFHPCLYFLCVQLLFQFCNLRLALLQSLNCLVFLNELPELCAALGWFFASFKSFTEIFKHFELVSLVLKHLIQLLHLLFVVLAHRFLVIAENSYLSVAVIVKFYLDVHGIRVFD